MTDAVRSWNWKGYEGKPVRVEVYSDAEEVELRINGTPLERKKVGRTPVAYNDLQRDETGRFLNRMNAVVFETVYEPGVLEAAAYRDGLEVSRDILKTASDAVEMKITADCREIPADGSDICYVELELVDAEGIRNPGEIRKVSVSVDGAGYLLGFGSADPESEENYFDTEARTYEGRLRAAIRAKESGIINVTFTGENMKSKSVQISAK